jgi:hypothetical protein
MKTKKTKTKHATTNPAKTKAGKPAKATAKADAKKLSQIEAAVAVLAKAGEPMNCKAMVEAMAKQGLWSSPGGATPDATLYASILREINTKGKDARFSRASLQAMEYFETKSARL